MYDFVFVTHLPSFYKVNLYRELSKQYRVAAIFIGGGSVEREENFKAESEKFDSYYLSSEDFETSSVFKNIVELHSLLKSIEYKIVIVGGWERLEFWYCVLQSKTKQSALALEATIYETNLSFKHLLVKRLFCKFISKAFPSGMPHSLLLRAANFTGKQYTTHGVGLLNFTAPQIGGHEHLDKKDFTGRILFVGRLATEKNLDFLIECVNRDNRLTLTIIGEGPERSRLEEKATNRISFTGFVNNEELSTYYQQSDILALTSHRETWGLVVEEAALNGCPSLVNSVVGCNYDLVLNEHIGLVYQAGDYLSFTECINKLFDHIEYSQLVNNCTTQNYFKRQQAQINAYDLAIKELCRENIER